MGETASRVASLRHDKNGEQLRREAERRHVEILHEAEAAIASETEEILAAGRREADALKAKADANLERAIDRLIEKFKGALNA